MDYDFKSIESKWQARWAAEKEYKVTEEGTCYVSLSSALLDGQPDPASLTQAVASLEQSLLSLETVENVCFLVDGELSETFGPVKLPD